MTSRPPFTSSTAASGRRAAVEAKAEEGLIRASPLNRPAAGGFPTTRASFTSPATDPMAGTAGAKADEAPSMKQAPKTRPAPHGPQAGPEAPVTGPAAPTTLPGMRHAAIAQETRPNESDVQP